MIIPVHRAQAARILARTSWRGANDDAPRHEDGVSRAVRAVPRRAPSVGERNSAPRAFTLAQRNTHCGRLEVSAAGSVWAVGAVLRPALRRASAPGAAPQRRQAQQTIVRWAPARARAERARTHAPAHCECLPDGGRRTRRRARGFDVLNLQLAPSS